MDSMLPVLWPRNSHEPMGKYESPSFPGARWFAPAKKSQMARPTASFWGELKIPRTSQQKSHNHKWQSRTFSWNLNLYRNTNLQTAAGLKPSEPEPSIKNKPVSSTSSAGAEPTQLSTCSKSPVLSPKKTYNWSDAEFAKQNAIIASTWLSKQI